MATGRRVAAGCLLLAACAAAGAQLPATAPTAMQAPLAATPVAATDTRPHRATITFAAGMLNVRANNSSLNQILRDISRQTGMKITGGVTDQRVFGEYGPADPSTILTTLLDGTGVNIQVNETSADAPKELVLTPRGGGPTPPSPISVQDDSIDDNPAPQRQAGPDTIGPAAGPGFAEKGPTATQQAPPLPISGNGSPSGGNSTTTGVNAAAAANSAQGPQPIEQPLNNVLGNPNTASPSAATLPVTNSVSTDSLRTPSTAQPVSGIVDSPGGPPANTTTSGFGAAAAANAASPTTPTNDADTSGSTSAGGSTSNAGTGGAPSGIKTPEDIFKQLQALRQTGQGQQSTQSPTQPASTTAPPAQTTPNQTPPPQ